jgi:hypothetical protein
MKLMSQSLYPLALSLIATGVALSLVQPPVQAAPLPDTSQPLTGVFYNLGLQEGGTVTVKNWSYNTKGLTGFANATQFSDSTTPICGAGNTTAKRTGMTIAGSFVSNDPDVGCTFDKGAIISYNGTIAPDLTSGWGNYQIKNAGGSRFLETPGVYEVWAAGKQPKRKIYQGTFTSGASQGVVRVEMVVGTNTVSGYANFSNLPGKPILCSAGKFAGLKRADQSMQIGFVSNDPDSGCGFDKGWRMVMNGKLSTNQNNLNGTFQVVGQTGTFSATLVK